MIRSSVYALRVSENLRENIPNELICLQHGFVAECYEIPNLEWRSLHASIFYKFVIIDGV